MSARGGVRPGAGRPKGSRGRRARMVEERVRSAVGDFCPVAFLCSVAADAERPIELRVDCAKGAAPYLAPRLKSIEVDTGIAFDMTELVRRLNQQREQIEKDGHAAVPVVDAVAGARMVGVKTGVPRCPGVAPEPDQPT